MNHSSIVVTGATGFLGEHLCTELLQRTTARIHCLVRATDAHAATSRLRFLRVPEHLRHRLIAVPSDLSRPHLGLTNTSWDKLAEAAHSVYHCGASVDFSAPYEQCAAINVRGTKTLLSLAEHHVGLTGRPCHFHHVSTLGIFYGATPGAPADVDESTRFAPDPNDPVGYRRSKAEAEAAVWAAAHKLPVTIHRPGAVTGVHATGHTGASDIVTAALRAMLTLGAAPIMDATFPIDTVDTVAAGIVVLALDPSSTGRAFHHVRPRPLPIADLATALRRVGHRLRLVPASAWLPRLDALAHRSEVMPALMLARMVKSGGLGGAPSHPRFHADETWKALHATGMTAPPLDSAYLQRLVSQVVPIAVA